MLVASWDQSSFRCDNQGKLPLIPPAWEWLSTVWDLYEEKAYKTVSIVTLLINVEMLGHQNIAIRRECMQKMPKVMQELKIYSCSDVTETKMVEISQFPFPDLSNQEDESGGRKEDKIFVCC